MSRYHIPLILFLLGLFGLTFVNPSHLTVQASGLQINTTISASSSTLVGQSQPAFPTPTAVPLGDLGVYGWRARAGHDILSALGNPNPTPAMIGIMVEWMYSEDGSDNAYLRNNPLNTTLCLPGRMTGAINGDGACGVQGYATYDDGIEATIATLRQGNFTDLRNALLGTDAAAARQAIWNSPWAASRYGNGSAWHYL